MELCTTFTDNIAAFFEYSGALVTIQIGIDFLDSIRNEVVNPAIDIKLTIGVFSTECFQSVANKFRNFFIKI